MGVKGLWKLLEPAAQPISSLDALRGQIIAIDVSIWVHRLLKSGTGSHERALLTTFSRISKLLYYGIRPVFVFDGAPPAVKIETQRRRRTRREAASHRVERLRARLLEQVVEMQAETEAGTSASSSNNSAVVEHVLQQLRDGRQVDSSNDIFKLDDSDRKSLKASSSSTESESEDDGEEWQTSKFDDEDDEGLINSAYFNELPPEVRHDMLIEMRNKRKYAASIASSQGGSASFLPQDSSDFSAFQIRRALAGSKIAGKLRETRNEIAANAVERAGADASLLRRLLFSGKAASTTEIRIETGGASANSEYVLVHSRRQFDDIQSIAGIKGSNLPTVDQAEIDLFSKSQPSIISAPSSHFMKIGVFDASCYAVGTDNKRQLGNKPQIAAPVLSDDDEKSELANKNDGVPPAMAKPKEVECKKVSPLPVISSPTPISVSSDSEEVDDFEAVEPIEITGTFVVRSSVKEAPPCGEGENESENEVTKPSAPSVLAEILDQVEERGETNAVETPVQSRVELPLSPPSTQNSQHLEEAFGSFGAAERAENVLAEMEREKRSAVVPEESFLLSVMELCRAFGIPVVESPAEAESQAAALESAGLVNCCLTDDSDYWLFGGQRVIRGLFGSKKVEQSETLLKYEMAEIAKTTALDRETMICVALISGCDYCDGLRGCGPALALDIWREFYSKNVFDEDGRIIEPVRRFKEAVIATVEGSATLARSAALVVDRFLKRRKQVNQRQAGHQAIDIEDISEDTFPSARAVDAFLRPQVNISAYLADHDDDDNPTPLRWSQPDMERLKNFAKRQWKWSSDRTEAVLAPILRRMDVTSNNPSQATLTALWHLQPTVSHVTNRRSLGKSPSDSAKNTDKNCASSGKRRKRN